MSTVSQDNRFGGEFLSQIVDWISENMEPDDVFSREKIISKTKELSPAPDDLFSDEELYNWASDHGMEGN